MKTFNLTLVALISLVLFSACGEKAKKQEMSSEPMVEETSKAPEYDTNNPKTILEAVAHAHGGWGDLWKKHDVQYMYDYRYPSGDADVSVERYIFDSEASYGKYLQHEINIMPGEKGEVVQLYDGNNTLIKVDDKKMDDPQLIGLSDFLRRANYYWFTMPYKLNDEGTVATYMGQDTLNGTTYDKVKVTYDPQITGKEQNDSYILYVNPETKRIDRFYFSLPFLGVNEPLIIADYSYENIEGQWISTKREYYMPSENGYSETPNLTQTLTEISFNNGFTVENLME